MLGALAAYEARSVDIDGCVYREGLQAVRRSPRLRGTLVVTILFNIFGWPFTSLVPVVAQEASTPAEARIVREARVRRCMAACPWGYGCIKNA